MTSLPPGELYFDPPNLSKSEGSVLRAALVRYAKECDAKLREATSPQEAVAAAREGDIARKLTARLVKAEQRIARPFPPPGVRPIR